MREADELETRSSSGGAASAFGAYPSGVSLNCASSFDWSFESFKVLSSNGSPSALESELAEPFLLLLLYTDLFSLNLSALSPFYLLFEPALFSPSSSSFVSRIWSFA